MSTCLKIGDRLFNSEQIVSALVQYQILEPLVGQVILDDVLQEVPLSEQELFYALAGSRNTPMPEDLESFLRDWCQQQGVTPDYFRRVVLRKLRLEKFKQLGFATQVESEFLRIKSTLDLVEYSLIQLADLSLARELYFQLRDDGADFTQFAQRYSIGKECQTGGRVGPVPIASLPIEVAKLFQCEPAGTICGPVAIEDRFWVVRLERLAIAQLTEATYSHLLNQLYSQWLQSQVKTLIATPGAIAVQTSEESTGAALGEARTEGSQIEETRTEEMQIKGSQIEGSQVEDVWVEETLTEDVWIEEARAENARIEEAGIGEMQIEETRIEGLQP
jgi:parvulin-like peptidyl-prolyl isomerase